MAKEPTIYDIQRNWIKNLALNDLVKIGRLVLQKPVSELEEIATEPDAPVLTVMIASVAANVIRTGDMRQLNQLLDRLIGPVKQDLAITGSIANPPNVTVVLPYNNRTQEDMVNVTPQKQAKQLKNTKAKPISNKDLGLE